MGDSPRNTRISGWANGWERVSNWLVDSDLTRKAYLNALAIGLDYGARVVVGFVLNPLLVAGLGSYLFGLWHILIRTVGYLSASSGRTPQALRWTIANRQTSTDHAEKQRQVGSALAVWVLFLPIVIVVGGAFGWVAPSLLGIPIELGSSVRVAIGILIINLIALSLADIPRSVLAGENLEYKGIGISTGLTLVGGGFTAVALHLGGGLSGVAVAQLAATVLSGLVFLAVTKSYVSWFGVARPSPEARRRFLGLSSWFMVWRLVMQAMMVSDIVLLGVLGRIDLVTTYVLTKYAADAMIGFGSIVTSAVAPGLGGIIGSGRTQKAISIRAELMAASWLMSTTIGATVVLWNRHFLALWVGREHYAGLAEILLIVLMLTQFVFIRNDAQVIDLTLNVRSKVLLGGASVVVSLMIAGTLVHIGHLGISGVCGGFIVGRLMLSIAYPVLLGRFLGLRLKSQVQRAGRPAGVTAIVLASATILEPTLIAHTWTQLIVGVAITLIMLGIVTFYGGLTREVRGRFVRRLTHVAI